GERHSAVDGHARSQSDPLRYRAPSERSHRRRRRSAGNRDRSRARPVPVRYLRPHRLSLRACRDVCVVPGGTCARQVAVRLGAAGRARKSAPHDYARHADRARRIDGVRDRVCNRGRRRRLTYTNHAVRLAGHLVVPAFRRCAGDPDYRRHRPALRRIYRRNRVSVAARLARRTQPGLLVLLDRSLAGCRRGVLSEGDRAVGRDAGAAPAPTMTDAASDQSVLETRDLRMAFGGLVVFENLNFSLRRGERHAIIGPNGAGKTTFVSLVTGLLRPSGGDVMFNGSVITHASPQQRVKAGIARTFQINSLFKALNPLASLVIALAERDGGGGIVPRSVARQTGWIEEASALLAKFGLADDALVTTEKLPYGKQRLLEVALALALRPQLLLLDEPAAGLSTEQGHELFRQLAILTGD